MAAGSSHRLSLGHLNGVMWQPVKSSFSWPSSRFHSWARGTFRSTVMDSSLSKRPQYRSERQWVWHRFQYSKVFQFKSVGANLIKNLLCFLSITTFSHLHDLYLPPFRPFFFLLLKLNLVSFMALSCDPVSLVCEVSTPHTTFFPGTDFRCETLVLHTCPHQFPLYTRSKPEHNYL